MSSRRLLKAASAIREVVSMAIIADLKDPRIRDVTVTKVEVTPDMRQAKVHVSIMGPESKQALVLRGLQNSAGFLQSRISDRIDTRYIPKLEFVVDLGVKHSLEVARILHEVLPGEDKDQPEAEDESAEEEFDTEDSEDSEVDSNRPNES